MNNSADLRSFLVKLSKRFIFLLLTAVIVLFASGQNPDWKTRSITPDVAIFMPEPTTSIDTLQVRAINSQSNGYYYQLKYLKPKFKVKSGDELIQAYDGFLSGYLKTKDISIFANTVADTSLKGTMGEWIHSRYSKDSLFQEMYTYVVLVNSHFYMITIAAAHPITTTDRTVSNYFASLRFPVTPIKEYSGDFPLRAKSYRNGQHIGRWMNAYLPWILGVAIAVIFSVLALRRIRARKR